MTDFCKHWKELDAEDGKLFECCRKTMRTCYCCASENQCSFPGNFENAEEEAKPKIRPLGKPCLIIGQALHKVVGWLSPGRILRRTNVTTKLPKGNPSGQTRDGLE